MFIARSFKASTRLVYGYFRIITIMHSSIGEMLPMFKSFTPMLYSLEQHFHAVCGWKYFDGQQRRIFINKSHFFLQTGDVDIYIQDIPIGYTQKHGFGPYLQMATSMKKLLLIAEKDGIGQMIPIDENSQRVPNENEVFVGVYSELEESKRGQKFYFSMKNRSDQLRSSIAGFVGLHMPASWL